MHQEAGQALQDLSHSSKDILSLRNSFLNSARLFRDSNQSFPNTISPVENEPQSLKSIDIITWLDNFVSSTDEKLSVKQTLKLKKLLNAWSGAQVQNDVLRADADGAGGCRAGIGE